MASWSTRRRMGYFFGFLIVLGILIFVPFFFLFYKAPTCFDGKQNGSERGVDCGGSCAKLCPADYSAPRVLWSYSAEVVPGVFNSLAYIQNPNPSVEVFSMSYVFRLYDDQGILIAERQGRTFVPAGQKFAVFEGGINVGQRVPKRTTFEFTEEPQWRGGVQLTRLKTDNVNLDQGNSPRAEANIRNDAVDQSFSHIDAFIILYDKDDNRVAFSKTAIDSIGPQEKQTLYFTWPEPFKDTVVRTEVVFVPRPSK